MFDWATFEIPSLKCCFRRDGVMSGVRVESISDMKAVVKGTER